MRLRDVDQALSAANPIQLGGALPPLTVAEREFLGGVVAEPQEPAASRRGGRARRVFARARPLRLRYLGAATAVCAGALALLLIPSSGRGPAPVSPQPAYATELARIAKGDSPAIVSQGSRAVVVEQRANGRNYVVTPLEDNGWTEVDPAVVWDCTDLPCDRRTDTPQEARELFEILQRAGN